MSTIGLMDLVVMLSPTQHATRDQFSDQGSNSGCGEAWTRSACLLDPKLFSLLRKRPVVEYLGRISMI